MNLRLTPLLMLALIAIAACGFQLRGSNLDVLQKSSVYVESSGANQLAKHVRRQLNYAGVNTINSATDADYVIQLSNETFNRNILSVSPRTGKVEEFELSYQANLSVTGINGDKLLSGDSITATRDYTFDDGAVLGNFEQENVLREDITRQAAGSVLRRLEAITR